MFLDFTFTFQIVRLLFKLEFNFTLEFYIRLFASFSYKILYGDESKNLKVVMIMLILNYFSEVKPSQKVSRGDIVRPHIKNVYWR